MDQQQDRKKEDAKHHEDDRIGQMRKGPGGKLNNEDRPRNPWSWAEPEAWLKRSGSPSSFVAAEHDGDGGAVTAADRRFS
jgi:hypothetical protein